MTTMNINKHELYNKISIDTITGYILDDLQNPEPPFLLECTRKLEKSIEEYTKQIMAQYQNSNSRDTTPIIEDHAGELLDSICESNHIYFETGMKMGALLLLQLLNLP